MFGIQNCTFLIDTIYKIMASVFPSPILCNEFKGTHYAIENMRVFQFSTRKKHTFLNRHIFFTYDERIKLVYGCFYLGRKRVPIKRCAEYDDITFCHQRCQFIEIIIKNTGFILLAETIIASSASLNMFMRSIEPHNNVARFGCSFRKSVRHKVAVTSPSWAAG